MLSALQAFLATVAGKAVAGAAVAAVAVGGAAATDVVELPTQAEEAVVAADARGEGDEENEEEASDEESGAEIEEAPEDLPQEALDGQAKAAANREAAGDRGNSAFGECVSENARPDDAEEASQRGEDFDPTEGCDKPGEGEEPEDTAAADGQVNREAGQATAAEESGGASTAGQQNAPAAPPADAGPPEGIPAPAGAGADDGGQGQDRAAEASAQGGRP